MSSPCLSSVLTHANLTMYQTGLSDVLLQEPSTLPLSTSSTCSKPSAPSYRHSSPHSWTEEQVLEWIGDHVDDTKFDASFLSLAYCAVNGSTLCQMKTDQMIGVFGPQLGPQLHQSLQDHKSKYDVSFSVPELNETCQLLDTFLDNLNYPLLSTLRFGQVEEVVSKREFDFPDDYDLSLPMEPMAAEYLSDGGYMSSSNESASNESEPELSCHVISKVQIKLEKDEPQLKRPRGRPPKMNQEHGSIYSTPKKTKHAPRGTHLWEFIRDILIHPEKNQGLMKWEDRHEGVFKFLKSEAVAQMWGQKKRNSSMTYEKLSRAMRYYYKRDILERVDGRRLVYKFGKNSSGWKMEEMGMQVMSEH